MSYAKENIANYVIENHKEENIADYGVESLIAKRQREHSEYMESKYRSAYIGALAKLNAPNRFDEKGLLKREYELTDMERDALKFYVPVENLSTNNIVNERKTK